MPLEIDRELEGLQQMPVGQLLGIYRHLFGRPSNSRHKQHLIRSIAWGLQAQAEGGLSQRALAAAAEIVQHTELQLPTQTGAGRPASKQPRRRRPIPGTVLSRPYKGKTLQVIVLDDGFEYQGQVFATLSALAKSITGSHWNGNLFFGFPSQHHRQRKGSV